MPRKITIYGDASLKTWPYQIKDSELALNALEWLQSHDIPVASSCRGEGKCRKCLINSNLLACQEKMETLGEIRISYL